MQKRDLTRYSDYFTVSIPNSQIQALSILLLGILAGGVASLIVHWGTGNTTSIMTLGASSGILIISVPAFLTVLLIRIVRRKMKMKHAMFAVLAISAAYAAFMVIDASVYHFLNNGALAYVLLILVNAGIYGYWLVINKIAVGQKKSAIITSQVQPVLNVLMFLPFGGYLLNVAVPVDIAIIKLFAGILVFLIMGYLAIYLLDRPAKKNLYVSSIQLFSTMVGQWLYDLNADTRVLGAGGVERDVKVDVITLYKKGKLNAVFVKPDIHYGPFGTVGGSVFTDVLGSAIVNRYGATPIIMHGAVNIEDNPISTKQVSTMANRICEYIAQLGEKRKSTARGTVGFGQDGSCRAINIGINGVNLLVLSKAPLVTEDIDREVGMYLESVASKGFSHHAVLVDAHNSRFETATEDELRGIYKGSKYIYRYRNAITQSLKANGKAHLKFGTAHMKMSKALRNVDLGSGYSSVAVFQFGKKRFCLLTIDANNMLPGFRESIIRRIKKRYRMNAELCTTDTHSVNSIALSARNALGRHTKYGQIAPLIDTMVEKALKNAGSASCSYGSFEFKRFKVWGANAEELITKVGMDIIRIGKYVVPFIIVLTFMIAGWIIYSV